MRAAGAILMAMLVSPVAAQATDYGGGTAPDSVRGSSRALTLVGIRTAGDGRARLTVLVSARCGAGKEARVVRPAADGTFAFDATVRDRVPDDPRVRRVARIVMSGQIAGAAAGGTVSAQLTFRRGGRVVGRCRSGARVWQARVAAAEPAGAAARPDGAYHGLVRHPARPLAFVLRVDPRGRRVRTAVFEYRQRCRGGAFEWENVTPGAPIRADGSFRLRERFTIHWEQGVERYRVRVDGRFTPNGVSGTLSVGSVLRPPGGRVRDRCTTGRRAFAALL